jgi:hypothetical protein
MQVIQSVVEQEDGMLLIGLDRDDHLTLPIAKLQDCRRRVQSLDGERHPGTTR